MIPLDTASLPPFSWEVGRSATPSSTKGLLKQMEPRLQPLTNPGYDQAYFKYTGLLEFLDVGGKINKATGI